MRAYALRHQPAKGLYLIYQLISTLLVRIPLWVILAIPRSLRPRDSWNLKRVIQVKLLRHMLLLTSKTGPLTSMPDYLAITPGVNVNGIWVDPVPELIAGELKSWTLAASVSSVRIPGYWMHRKGSTIDIGAPPIPEEKVVYFLHGGAYIRLSAHPTDPTATITRGFLRHVNAVRRAFSIEYRLSSHKPYAVENPFPAALLDALAGYNHLVNVAGFSPSDIIVVGDSAGGNLAHALTRYLVEHKNAPNIPAPPGALVLLSPWSDLSDSHVKPGSSAFTCEQSDYISGRGDSVYAKDAFLGPFGTGATHNKYISPASLHPSMSISFKGFPKTFIVAGGAEVLLDQIRTLKDRMVKDLGEKVKYYEAKDSVHDYLVFEWHEPERTNTLLEIAKWVEGL